MRHARVMIAAGRGERRRATARPRVPQAQECVTGRRTLCFAESQRSSR